MAEYHFVSIWQISAPVERVWEEIYHAERWPDWWKYVTGVDELEPGAADGTGRRLRLRFRTRLPYTLGFDIRVTHVKPPSELEPSELEAEAAGELEGTGRWTLTSVDGGTLVRYDWDIRTTRRWMNLLAPVARPLFSWNHDELMREGGRSLARLLGARLLGARLLGARLDGVGLLGAGLVLPDVPSRPRRPARAARWAVSLAALAALSVLGWRRRASPR